MKLQNICEIPSGISEEIQLFPLKRENSATSDTLNSSTGAFVIISNYSCSQDATANKLAITL